MSWLLIVYFVGLVCLALNQEKIIDKEAFRKAWKLYAGIMVNYCVFSLLKLLPIIFLGLLSESISWLLISMSLFSLVEALVPEKSTEAADKVIKEDIYNELKNESTGE